MTLGQMIQALRREMCVSGGIALLCYAGKWGASIMFNQVLQVHESYGAARDTLNAIRVLQSVLDWGMIAAIVVLLTFAAALLRSRRK